MSTSIEQVAGLRIGAVDSVSPNSIGVVLELDAPQSMALNTGLPVRFPKINGYVIIPNEAGALVGLVSSIAIERSSFPKRPGLKDFGLVDLPFPLRKMHLTPAGTLVDCLDGQSSGPPRLERGVLAYPSVGDAVLLPMPDQLSAILRATGTDCRVQLGTSPLAEHESVTVDPDKLFGRHLAILGNTGSGKSCTVAALVRWSLEQAARQRIADKRDGVPNARFIILDPNGEYSTAFKDLGARVFRVPPVGPGENEITLPAWMWNSSEWCSLAAAAPGTQRPLLLEALRNLRAGRVVKEPVEVKVARQLRARLAMLGSLIADGPSGYGQDYRVKMTCGNLLETVSEEAGHLAEQASAEQLRKALSQVAVTATQKAAARKFTSAAGKIGYNGFSLPDLEAVVDTIEAALAMLPNAAGKGGMDADAPIPFDVSELPTHLEALAADEGGGAGQFIGYLTLRIRMMLGDSCLGPIVSPSKPMTFDKWLGTYIGEGGAQNGQLAIIDLSLVPTEVVHIVVAVFGRLVFEAAQRYLRLTSKVLPTVLVLEEAHSFVRRPIDKDENAGSSSTRVCRETFERVAREGRKYGLGLVVSSQRPSELSATVLAQCNTFILHRIVNDRDQDLVRRLVPDNLGGFLSELPSLPTRRAILVGWATPIPVLFEVGELPIDQRPRSSDPDFWDVWTGRAERPVDWTAIADSWSSTNPQDSSQADSKATE
jgi:hypothetical protein